MNINLHIERLILDGLPIKQRDAALVRDAIEGELTEALLTDGLAESLSNGGTFAAVPDSTIVTRDARADSIGQQIARAVYRGVGSNSQGRCFGKKSYEMNERALTGEIAKPAAMPFASDPRMKFD